jgi:2-(3-amino-3-carboxypropyl)histidine synthase
MHIIHVPVHWKGTITLPEKLLDALPKKIALFTTAPFIDHLDAIKKQLEKNQIHVELLQPRHTAQAGQLLGCSTKPLATTAEAFLFVGDGEFHPQALLIGNDKPVYRYDPTRKHWELYASTWVETIKKRRKGALVAFHSAKKIGILSTTKSGQQRLGAAKLLEKKFPDKQFYILLADTIEPGMLENFPFIECIVNTACPRIGIDDLEKCARPVVNLDDLGIEW